MTNTDLNITRNTLDFDAILDVTVEAKLTERQQFERFLRRRDAQRVAVQRELRSRRDAELRRTNRVLKALAER